MILFLISICDFLLDVTYCCKNNVVDLLKHSLFFCTRLNHQLTFEDERIAQAKDATKTNTEDYYDIYDPRNSLNVRRREQLQTKKTKK